MEFETTTKATYSKSKGVCDHKLKFPKKSIPNEIADTDIP